MNKHIVQSTLTSFLRAWENKNIEAVLHLLADSFEYFESPLEKPLTTTDQVRTLWSPVPKLNADVSLSFETLAITDEFGLFRIRGTYQHHDDGTVTNIDRIFLLAVEVNGKITKFMQWRESAKK